MSSAISRSSVRGLEYPELDTGFLTKADIKSLMKEHKPKVLDPKSALVALFWTVVGSLIVNFTLSRFGQNIPLHQQDKRFLEFIGAITTGCLAIYLSHSAKETCLTKYKLQKNMLRPYELYSIVEGETIHDILELGTNGFQNHLLKVINASQFFEVKQRTFLRRGTLAQKIFSHYEMPFKTSEKVAIAWQHKFLTSLYFSLNVQRTIPENLQAHSENVFGVYCYQERIRQFLLAKLDLDNMGVLYSFADKVDDVTLQEACAKLSRSKEAKKNRALEE